MRGAWRSDVPVTPRPTPARSPGRPAASGAGDRRSATPSGEDRLQRTVTPELDVRLLRYFVAVAEELHFTRAANRLFVAQQALSRDIQRLEERVGVPLLERTTRRVTLTPAGQQLLVR